MGRALPAKSPSLPEEPWEWGALTLKRLPERASIAIADLNAEAGAATVKELGAAWYQKHISLRSMVTSEDSWSKAVDARFQPVWQD